MRESDEVFRAVVAACVRCDGSAMPSISGTPDSAITPPREWSAHSNAGGLARKRVAAPHPNDRDHDRIRNRDDDRDQAGRQPRSSGTGDQRRAWFLDELGSGRRVAAAGIVERWGVSEKTARRDIAVLTASGLIAFIGTRRSGVYRLVSV